MQLLTIGTKKSSAHKALIQTATRMKSLGYDVDEIRKIEPDRTANAWR